MIFKKVYFTLYPLLRSNRHNRRRYSPRRHDNRHNNNIDGGGYRGNDYRKAKDCRSGPPLPRNNDTRAILDRLDNRIQGRNDLLHKTDSLRTETVLPIINTITGVNNQNELQQPPPDQQILNSQYSPMVCILFSLV